MKDIRQSENWGKYLETLGWKYYKVEDVLVFVRSLGFASVIKIQRPEGLLRGARNDGSAVIPAAHDAVILRRSRRIQRSVVLDSSLALRMTSSTLIQKIDELALANKALFVKCEVTNAEDEKVLIENGFKRNLFPLVNPSTVILNLKLSESELWGNLKKDAKQSIKKSEVEIKFYKNADVEIRKVFWELLNKCGKEKGFYVQPYSDLNSKIEIFKEESVISLAYFKGVAVAGALILNFDGNSFYTHAGANKIGRETFASYKLLWETALFLRKEGIEFFDLEGIYDSRFPSFTKNWSGFTLFKMKFGGKIVEFPAPYIKYYNKVLAGLDKVMGNLPL